MADINCALTEGATGNWADAATWQGGVVPTVNEKALFSNSVTINNPIAASVEIAEGKTLTFVIPTHFYWMNAGGRLLVRKNAKLKITGDFQTALTGVSIDAEENAVIETEGTLAFGSNTAGMPEDCHVFHPTTTLRSVRDISFYVSPNNQSRYSISPGVYEAPNIGLSNNNADGGVFVFRPGRYVLRGKTRFVCAANRSCTINMGSAAIEADALVLNKASAGSVLRVEQQEASFSVTGNISTVEGPGALAWSPGKTWTLAGTQDQSVSLPEGMDDCVTLTIDKQAGKLSLGSGSPAITLVHAGDILFCGSGSLEIAGNGRCGTLSLIAEGATAFRCQSTSIECGSLLLLARSTTLRCSSTASRSGFTLSGDLVMTEEDGGKIVDESPGKWKFELVEDGDQHVKTVAAFDESLPVPVPFDIEKPAGTVFLERYVGTVYQCRAHRLIVGAASVLRLCQNSPEGMAYQSFSGRVEHLENDGELLFVCRSNYRPTSKADYHPDTCPVLEVETLRNDGMIRPILESGAGHADWYLPYKGRLRLAWTMEKQDLKQFSEQIDLQLYRLIVPQFPQLSVKQLSGGSLQVRLNLQALCCHTIQVQWGEYNLVDYAAPGTLHGKELEFTHTYTNFQSYTITVTGSNNELLSHSESITVALQAGASAVLLINPSIGSSPLDVLAHTTGSSGSHHLLDWGDGSHTETLREFGVLEHTYHSAGDYLAVLNVWNEPDAVARVSQTVSVAQGIAEDLQACLNVEPAAGYAPLTVIAKADGSGGSRFRFDWGDGTSTSYAAQRQAGHTYTRAGVYPVTLTVKEGAATASASKVIVVQYSEPVAAPFPVLIRPDRGESVQGLARLSASPYRLTLAQGKAFMVDTLELFCEMNQCGRAAVEGSSLFLARIQRAGGGTIDPGEFESVRYSIWRLDDRDATVAVGVSGHVDVPLVLGEVLLPDLIVDENWTFDTLGYNFRHTPDGSLLPLFPTAGRHYRVEYRIVPKGRFPELLLRYRVHVV